MLLNRGRKSDCVGRSALLVLHAANVYTHLDNIQIELNVHSFDSKTVYRHSALDFFKKVIIVYIKQQVGRSVNR